MAYVTASGPPAGPPGPPGQFGASPVGGSTPRPTPRGVTITWKRAVALVVAGLVVWFMAVNHESVAITFWLVDIRAALWLVLACTFGLGLVAGRLLGRRRK